MTDEELKALLSELDESLLDCHRRVSMMFDYFYAESGEKKGYAAVSIYEGLDRSLRNTSTYFHQLKKWLL